MTLAAASCTRAQSMGILCSGALICQLHQAAGQPQAGSKSVSGASYHMAQGSYLALKTSLRTIFFSLSIDINATLRKKTDPKLFAQVAFSLEIFYQ